MIPTDHSLSIVNPGGLPAGLDAKDFGRMSVRRNLIIGDLFHRMGKVERVGSGIGRMRDFMSAARLAPPAFEITTFFRVIFHRNPEYSLKKDIDKSSVKSSVKIVALIKQDQFITIPMIAKSLGLTTRSIEKQLANLQAKGVIRRLGPDKGGHWEIIPAP